MNPAEIPGTLRNRDPRAARAAFRALLAQPRAALLPGVVDSLTARLVEEAGFGACYLTGAGVANALFGVADVGLTTATEMAQHAARVVAATHLPVVVDADTGYGNPINVMRTVAELERAGVAAIQLEDQTTPKRCGHFDGKDVIAREEMVQKVRAAVAARTDPALAIVARTDAAATEGLDAALERARAYAEAGADVLFVEAPRTLDALRRIPREVPSAPHLVNMVEGGRTPTLPLQDLDALGFRLVLYANFAMRAAAFAVREALLHLAERGDTRAYEDRILPWAERQRLVDLPAIGTLEREFRADAAGGSSSGAEAGGPS